MSPNCRSEETGVSTKDGRNLDAWAWGVGDFRQPEEIQGLAQSVTYMLEYMQEHGPFVGAIGFSCGATLAAILSSLLEGGKSVEGFTFPERVRITFQCL
jgi:thioesterase domain-containing protein